MKIFLISIIYGLTCFDLHQYSRKLFSIYVLNAKIYTYNINNIQFGIKSKAFTTAAAVPIN